MSADSIEFWQSGEWTMVYLNGELVKFGDSYHADEWLQERYGVVVVQEPEADACIPDGLNPFKTLAEAKAEVQRRADASLDAEAKRVKARQLLAEADALEGK